MTTCANVAMCSPCRALKWTPRFSARRLPYTAGRPRCRHPGCRTLLVFQAAGHCWSSRLPYTAGRPGCRTLLVVQACHRTLHQPQLTPEVVVSCGWGGGGACLHRRCSVVMLPVTLRTSLSGTFLQTLPDLVTPLKGHSLSPRSCPPTRSAPSERFGY